MQVFRPDPIFYDVKLAVDAAINDAVSAELARFTLYEEMFEAWLQVPAYARQHLAGRTESMARAMDEAAVALFAARRKHWKYVHHLRRGPFFTFLVQEA